MMGGLAGGLGGMLGGGGESDWACWAAVPAAIIGRRAERLVAKQFKEEEKTQRNDVDRSVH